MQKKLIFITGNKEKIAIARAALEGTPFRVDGKQLEIDEIQSDDIEEIAARSAQQAARILGEDVIKVDTGLFIEALNGFPGPYSAYVERHLDASHILRMMEGIDDRRAHYYEALAFCSVTGEPVLFATSTFGRIATELSGDHGWNFDRMFIAEGDNQPMANYDDETRVRKYSGENWKNLAKFLTM